MAREGAQQRNPLWLKILAGGLVAIVLLAVATVLLPQFLLSPGADVVMIKAGEGPLKEKPKDAGGMEIPHQDTKVMGLLNDILPEKETPEVLRPPAATPEMPPTPVADTDATSTDADPQPVPSTDASNAADSQTDQADASAVPSDNGAAKSNGSDTGEMADMDASPDAGAKQPTEDQELADVTVPVAKPGLAERPARIGSADAPRYVIQLAAFRDAAKATEQAGMLAQKHASRLQGATLGTMKIETSDNGVFWRVVSESLPREIADSICSALKRSGQDCILRKFNVLSQ